MSQRRRENGSRNPRSEKNSMRTYIICFALIPAFAVVAYFYLTRLSPRPEFARASSSVEAPTSQSASSTPDLQAPILPQEASSNPSIPMITDDPTADFHARLRAIHALPDNLTRSDIEALHAYLSTPGGEPGEIVIKNDLLNVLRRQTTFQTGHQISAIENLLVDIYSNTNQSVILRDYVIQHLVTWHPHAEDKTLIRDTLWSALSEVDSSIAGTALLGLHRLSSRNADIDSARIAEVAVALAEGGNPESASSPNPAILTLEPQTLNPRFQRGAPEPSTDIGELTQIAALRVCGERGLKKALPVAQKLAEKAETIPIQIAAIAALGDMGNWQEEIVLLELSKANNPRLKLAVESALMRLRKRTTGKGT